MLCDIQRQYCIRKQCHKTLLKSWSICSAMYDCRGRLLQTKVHFSCLNKCLTSVYHLQTTGLIKRFNQMLKRMLCKLVDKGAQNWHQLIPHVLSDVPETPQASIGFIPLALLFGRPPHWQHPSQISHLTSSPVLCETPSTAHSWFTQVMPRPRSEQSCHRSLTPKCTVLYLTFQR